MWRTRAIAATVAFGWLALVGRWLLHVAPVSRQTTVAPMELLWLAPAPAAPPTTGHRRASARDPHPAAVARNARSTALQAVAPPDRPAMPDATPSPDALRAQARAWADAQAQETAAAPWADRAARVPGQAAERFAMRDPPSLAGALGKVGALFGGPGYDPDPCPRRRENLAALVAAGDSARLRHELDFVRRHCRP